MRAGQPEVQRPASEGVRPGSTGSAAGASGSPAPLLTDLLRQVSRSFYLTLRILPSRIRRQISLAYLLARATDTLADTDAVPVGERLATLALFREKILGRIDAPFALHSFSAGERGSNAERQLLTRLEDLLCVLASFSPEDQALVREVVGVIISGQELDLQRFEVAPEPSAAPTSEGPALRSLDTEEELDDYTWRVAGCVGEFWTRMCRAHLFGHGPTDDPMFLANGIRFGKGLQLVNILRDLPADLRKGRCYVPGATLRSAGLAPRDLLDSSVEPRFRPIYNAYLATAHNHLAAGWEYTLTIPFRFFRLRLACAWPILIGVKTLARLRSANVLTPGERVKVTRAEVRKLLALSVLTLPTPGAWRELFARAEGR